ncbi:MAG: hypothetical protein KDA20_06015 [Phycisphaerales bacterium]|nr:hypothetical protein [Phycisphaerales bacterium]
MDRTDRLLARAARWMALLRLTRTVVVCLSIGTAAIVLARAMALLTSLELPWGAVWAWAMGAAVVVAVVWTWMTRPNTLAIARRVDEGAGLRESLSSALVVRGQDDPWSKATAQHAERLAGGVVLRQAIPAAMPRLWPAPLLAVGVFFLLGLIHPVDVFGWGEKQAAVEQEAQELQTAKQTLAETNEAVKQADALLAELGSEMAKPDEPADTPTAEPRTPEQLRVEAARKLTSAANKLENLRGEHEKKLDAVRQKFARLKTPPNTPQELGEFMQAMQKGDLSEAKNALQKMQDAMQSGEGMTPEQQEQLQQAMEQMAQQLQQLSKQQDALEQALADAGLDRNLANDMNALQQALQNAQNLNQAQKDALQKMAQNQQFANQQCQNMAQACQNMAQGQNAQQMAQAMQGMAGQLSDLEMMQMSMKDMQAQMANLQKLMGQAGQCTNPGQADAMNWFSKGQPGGGKSGLGEGGGQMDSEAAAFKLKKDKAIGQNQGGPIVGSTLIEAGQIKGESVQQFSEAVQAGAAEASQAIEEMTVPREYQEAVKGYFEELNGTVHESAPAETNEPAADDSDE